MASAKVAAISSWEALVRMLPSPFIVIDLLTTFSCLGFRCHCRMVYLPMCYLYCVRFKPTDVETNEVLVGLRQELYCENYATINWDAHRQTCAPIDEYSQLNPVMKIAQDFLSVYESWFNWIPFVKSMRAYALKFVIEYIHTEDLQTNYVDIGPVNKSLNMLSVWHDGGCSCDSEAFQKHLTRLDDYLWVAEDGMKMQGYNGSQCWDTSFAAQAIIEGDLVADFPECSRKIYDFLRRTQIAEDEVGLSKQHSSVILLLFCLNRTIESIPSVMSPRADGHFPLLLTAGQSVTALRKA